MGERVTDQAYWIAANGVDDPEMAQLVSAALVSPGDWGAITVRTEGRSKLVTGPVSTLVLRNEAEAMRFAMLLEDYADGEAG